MELSVYPTSPRSKLEVVYPTTIPCYQVTGMSTPRSVSHPPSSYLPHRVEGMASEVRVS